MASTTTRPPRRAAPPAEPDAPAQLPYRRNQRRAAILGAVLLGVFAALFLRLWALQVLSGTKYADQAQAQSFRPVPLQAPRGAILDRNRVPLVTNAAASAIQVWPADLPQSYTQRFAVLKRLAHVARVPLYEIARGIKERSGDVATPVTIREAASGPMVTYLLEHANEFPGVTIGRSYIRHYPYQQLAAQVLGYVGSISSQQLKRLGKGYDLNDEIGQSGVESTYDSYLRGESGEQRLHIDSLGRPLSAPTPARLPKPGNTVRLTIDLKLQQAAERALADGIRLAQADGEWAANGGAIVALDPNDGSILAMASSPTYKPSVYAGRVTTKTLAESGLTTKTATAANFPALNRALQVTYPPGSTFKPVTALAAMEDHLVSPYSYLSCTGSYHSPNDKAHQTFKNWDPFVNQAMDLPTALAYSCDTYFYQLGDRFYGSPGQPLQDWARRLGFGSVTGTDAGPEVSGLVPTVGWRHHRFTRATDPCCWEVDRLWKPGHSIQLAIGQGDLLVTPLQMARFYALLANGGKLVVPHVLMDVETPNGTPVPVPARPAPQQVRVDPTALQIVRQGLWEATHLSFGTSYPIFGHFPVSVAGKTGTAEKIVTLPGYKGLKDQSWWCGYGPTDDAKLVVCAVIENGGHGGTAAAPAAAEVFSSYFHVKLRLSTPTKTD
ncbi:MAG TPA: penicillin-binding protein 2 [Gaiellaceae bacterium]|nr:penicillin-binding protein 2 [Gaiellaceae bacterium]